jgi:hypothetical protein
VNRLQELQREADARVVSATMRGIKLAQQIQKELDEELLDTRLERR